MYQIIATEKIKIICKLIHFTWKYVNLINKNS